MIQQVFPQDRIQELERQLALVTAQRDKLRDDYELNVDQDFRSILDEIKALWREALERESNLARAVADVMWKATPYGETEDGDVYAYIVPKGCMHRLIGVAQQNGARVPVAFRALQ